jgi:hypothetical protein
MSFTNYKKMSWDRQEVEMFKQAFGIRTSIRR